MVRLFLHRDMIATGCEDKNVRVYYLATSSDQPLKVFTGHSAKVFHVRWSPLREGILCSGSDDGWVLVLEVRSQISLFYVSTVLKFVYWSSTVRIWDYTQDACINVLSGHTAPVRGLMWNTEVPHLLISGTEPKTNCWFLFILLWPACLGEFSLMHLLCKNIQPPQTFPHFACVRQKR